MDSTTTSMFVNSSQMAENDTTFTAYDDTTEENGQNYTTASTLVTFDKQDDNSLFESPPPLMNRCIC